MFIGFRVEWKRIFSKKLLIIFILLLLLSQYLVFMGIQDYKRVLDRQENFNRLEKLRFKDCVSYELYAATGFKIMCQPSSLMVFFRNSSDIGVLETNINTSDIIEIYKSKKAQRIFSNVGKFSNLGGLILYFGTLLMMFMGISTFKNRDHLNLFTKKEIIKVIAYRLIILDLFLILIEGLTLLTAMLKGVYFTGNDLNAFVNFVLYSIVLLNFFFFLGLLSALLSKFKGFSYIFLLIFWLTFLLLLPELMYTNLDSKLKDTPSQENINLKKLTTLLNMQKNGDKKILKKIRKETLSIEEKKAIAYKIVSEYIVKAIAINNKMEIELHTEVRELIQNKIENISGFFPGNYYSYLTGEISGVGYNEYLRFFKYILDLKDRFYKYYIHKRYLSDDKKVELFIKGNENIFKAKSLVPKNFWTVLWLTVLYCLILFGVILTIIFFRLNKKIKDRVKVDFSINHLEAGEFYFVQCRDDAFREKLYRQLSTEPTVVGLNLKKGEDIDLELPPKDIVPYFCKITGIKDIEQVNSIIEKLGVEEFKYFKYKKSKDVSEEDLKKIYAAVLLAGASDKEIIVMNDFLAGVRRTFERKLTAVLQEFQKQKKRIVYLSVDMFWSLSASEFNEIEMGNDFQIRQVSLEHISLI